MIIHGTHTAGMGISEGGRPAKWGTCTLWRVLAGLEVKLGRLVHIRRADVHVWVGSVGLFIRVGWKNSSYFISYVVVPI